MELKPAPNRLPARRISVDSQWDGVRIDRFLKHALPELPLSALHRLLRTGQVRLNGGRIKGEARLKVGDEIRIPPVLASVPAPSPILVPERLLPLMAQRLLWQDDHLLVVNKPATMPVHSGSGQSWGVVDLVREVFSRQHLPATPELVHRLDRDTSGCLLFALDKPTARQLAVAMKHHRLEKRYLVLVKGVPAKQTGRIDAPLAKGLVQAGERMVVSRADGERAVTHYRVEQAFATCSLVLATLETGRTHQIRAHFQHLGHPVAGDEKYGDRTFNRAMRELGLHRMFLHASHLGLDHPVTGQRLHIEAPLDPDLGQVLTRLAAPTRGTQP